MKNPMQKHDRFLTDTLFPMMIAHARRVQAPTEEAALVCFLALATILQTKGFSDDDLMAAIKAAESGVHPEPRTVQ